MHAHPGKKLMFMGCEFGQGREWNHDRSLDWHLLERPLHAGLRRFVADLNRVYSSERAMHEQDFTGGGFKWIDCNDHENSVVSLIRQDSSGEFVVGLFNFTPIPRDGYRVGVPVAGAYNELINSDSEIYGGGNLGNAGVVFTEPIAAHGYDQSLRLNLPPLGVPAAEARCRWSLIAVHCSRSALKGLATSVGYRIPNTEYRTPEHRTPNTEYRIPNYELMPTIRSHCSSSTGMTDRRDMRTSANDSKNLSALIAASVTGRGSFFTGSTSTA